MYKFALLSAQIPPKYKSLERSEEEYLPIEKIINSIKETKDWTIRREQNVLNQVLKSHDVLEFIRERNANGLIKINIFSIIYLSEYEKSKVINPKEIAPVIIPSNENKLKEFSFATLRASAIRELNERSILNICDPISLKASVMSELIKTNCLQRKRQLLMHIPN